MMNKKRTGNSWFIVEAIGLVFALVVLFLVSKLTDNVTRYELQTKLIGDTVSAAENSDHTDISAAEKGEETSVKEQHGITQISTSNQRDTYRNIVLFGVDSRERQLLAGTRSDTMIIASINQNTKEVKLVSIYRDTFLNVGDGIYNKANAAYAFGGPSRAVQMLNDNLDLDISDYVTVGFLGLIDTVDELGGIEINVAEEEIQFLNSYQICMAEELGLQYTPVEHAGKQILNGIQTTAYCRIRYTAGSDFMRTQRQRDVLISILDKSKTMSVFELNRIVDAVLPEVSTSLNVGEILELVASVYQLSVVDNTGIPFAENLAGANVGSKGSCVIPFDLCENVTKLHEFMFGDKDYVPSTRVQEYNEHIQMETSPYLAW